MDTFNHEIVSLLEKIRINSSILSEKHRKKYFTYKRTSNYFDIPTIILSSLGSSFSVGAPAYLPMQYITLTNCMVGIIISIMTSIKIYLNISDTLKNEIELSKAFYLLSIDIYKTLHLSEYDREKVNGIDYLNEKYNEYENLYRKSSLMERRFKDDQLVILPEHITFTPSNSSSEASTPRKKENEKIIEKMVELNSIDVVVT